MQVLWRDENEFYFVSLAVERKCNVLYHQIMTSKRRNQTLIVLLSLAIERIINSSIYLLVRHFFVGKLLNTSEGHSTQKGLAAESVASEYVCEHTLCNQLNFIAKLLQKKIR